MTPESETAEPSADRRSLLKMSGALAGGGSLGSVGGQTQTVRGTKTRASSRTRCHLHKDMFSFMLRT